MACLQGVPQLPIQPSVCTFKWCIATKTASVPRPPLSCAVLHLMQWSGCGLLAMNTALCVCLLMVMYCMSRLRNHFRLAFMQGIYLQLCIPNPTSHGTCTIHSVCLCVYDCDQSQDESVICSMSTNFKKQWHLSYTSLYAANAVYLLYCTYSVYLHVRTCIHNGSPWLHMGLQ